MMVSNAFAYRISGLKKEGAYSVLSRAQALQDQGRNIIHLEIGEPDFQTYDNIALSGIHAIADGKTKYNPPSGLYKLRQAIARDAGERRKFSFTPEQVTVAPGAKPIIFLAILALIEPGDEVICPDPGFPTYEMAIQLAGGKPVYVPLCESRGFDMDMEAFNHKVTTKTKLIVINSPGNPTGGLISRETLEGVAKFSCRSNCWVMSDEIYGRLIYNGDFTSIVNYPGMAERTLIVDGFSKTYAMTGWRIGYGIMPEPLARKMELLLTHSVGCSATFTQFAGLEAVSGPQEDVDAKREIFKRRREVMVEGLNAIPGFGCHLPQGAFYAFPNVKEVGCDVNTLASRLLDEAGVALLPGTAFGPGGDGYLRLSYANSIENIRAALTRISEAVKRM